MTCGHTAHIIIYPSWKAQYLQADEEFVLLIAALTLLLIVRQASVRGESQEGRIHMGGKDPQRDLLSTE